MSKMMKHIGVVVIMLGEQFNDISMSGSASKRSEL